MATDQLFLNGFRVELSAPSFEAFTQEMPDNDALRPLRDALEEEWFLYWDAGHVYGLPLVSAPSQAFGKPVTLQCQDHQRFLCSRIVSLFPQLLPKYRAMRRRPFTFLNASGKDIVSEIVSGMAGIPNLVSGFKIWKKFELDARIVEFVDNDPFIGVFLNVSTRWEVSASISELDRAGIDLHGLYVVRREIQQGERRLVGQINQVDGDSVTLLEAYDDREAIPGDEVTLEGSRATFARCLKFLLGGQYDVFEAKREQIEEKLLTGPALDDLLQKVGKFLRQKSPLGLGGGLTCSIKEQLHPENTPEYASIVVAQPVEYCFDAAKTKRSQYAWPGLERFGPYSRDTFSKRSPKVVVFFPDTKSLSQ